MAEAVQEPMTVERAISGPTANNREIQPLDDRVLVRCLDKVKKIGSIIVPDNARQESTRGEVVALGDGSLDSSGERIPLRLALGDHVIYGKYSGNEVKSDDDGEYLIIRECDVLAVMREGGS